MILSFHPCFEADKNIICAGREPDAEDLAAIKSAHAVILPQGCTQSLYKMASQNCVHVFPNFDTRFKYPSKIGQIQLFRETKVVYPQTETFMSVDSFCDRYSVSAKKISFDFPLVFKFDWGGEGENVFLFTSMHELAAMLQKAADYEKTGQKGFLIQEYIPCGNRSLRVVVIGKNIISYWRVQQSTEQFYTNLAHGAEIDFDSDPDIQAKAKSSVIDFCQQTRINLAGFDFLFSVNDPACTPIFLEINYFFGRSGLGGSEKFYELLNAEIKRWIEELETGK